MEYTIEDISPVEKKIRVTVPGDETTASISAAVAMYRARADVKGFRRGKVPSSIIEAKFKKDIYQEATTDLINVHINQIMGELGVTPLSGLDVDYDEMKKDETFEYTIGFEVAPEFEPPAYKGVKVEQTRPEVSDEEVASVEKRFLESLAKTEVLDEDRTPVDGDVVAVDFAVYEGDEVLDGIKADNFEMTLGKGEALEEFETLIKTLKPGESSQSEIHFPGDFINTRLAGKAATIKAKLHALKKRVQPELTDETVKAHGGFDSVEAMRKTIKESYAENKRQLARSEAQKKLLDSLLAQVDFPLPERLVKERCNALVQELRQRQERKGKSLESLGKSMEELLEDYRPEAEDMVRSELFLRAIATKEGLKVEPPEMEAFFNRLAAQTGQDAASLKHYYQENQLLTPLVDRLLADKAMEMIYANAEVVEIDPAENQDDKSGDTEEATQSSDD
ncbi:MAG: trigger factor [Desulfovibrionales bacterium]|nr:trigger factor [Desulfovibrionales bacterium]